VFTFVALVLVTPHVGFLVDRLRHFTEHNLMPLDHRNGARSFGLGFWGMLVGGGPWGQPCHLIHHLFPAVPWYAQLILHHKLKSLLTDRQRGQFLLRPVVGFPLMYYRLLGEPRRFADSAHRNPTGD
jgi:fatty acid desaturase